ncbi:MAG TPA: protein phosphatase 2C domain-containing protein [Acidimicrobiales bacterium]|nr:protein phosphatase 2C domain-containing protein [Acidimicrobiales bacterium]
MCLGDGARCPTRNQDRCAISPRWVVLSDGAGGHAGGALAAELTVECVVTCLDTAQEYDRRLLEEAVSRANDEVRARRRADAAVGNMAATLTVTLAASVDEQASRWLVASIGDSRAWMVSSHGARQLTEDDNVAAQLVRSGAITPEEALAHPGRHWITRAIGPEDRVAPTMTELSLQAGEALLLASDGLDVLTNDDLRRVIADAASPADAVGSLVDLALRHGAVDNVTVAVVRHVPSPS